MDIIVMLINFGILLITLVRVLLNIMLIMNIIVQLQFFWNMQLEENYYMAYKNVVKDKDCIFQKEKIKIVIFMHLKLNLVKNVLFMILSY